jgi:hypothetical protein
MSKRAALVALTQNRGEIDAALLARLLAASQSDSERVDRSFPTDARAKARTS